MAKIKLNTPGQPTTLDLNTQGKPTNISLNDESVVDPPVEQQKLFQQEFQTEFQ